MFQCTLDTEQVNQNSVNFFQGFYYEMTGLTGERSFCLPLQLSCDKDCCPQQIS